MESTSSGKCRRINALASEVARHQQVTKTADYRFNSRRRHPKNMPAFGGLFFWCRREVLYASHDGVVFKTYPKPRD